MDKETNKQTIPKLYNFVSKSSVLITVSIRKKKKNNSQMTKKTNQNLILPLIIRFA